MKDYLIDLPGAEAFLHEHFGSDFHARLQCYQMHIGLDSMAYHCYTKRWKHFEWSTKRTFEVARSQ